MLKGVTNSVFEFGSAFSEVGALLLQFLTPFFETLNGRLQGTNRPQGGIRDPGGVAVVAAKDDIGASYKAANATCGSLATNAKDICKAQAKGSEKVAPPPRFAS